MLNEIAQITQYTPPVRNLFPKHSQYLDRNEDPYISNRHLKSIQLILLINIFFLIIPFSHILILFNLILTLPANEVYGMFWFATDDADTLIILK